MYRQIKLNTPSPKVFLNFSALRSRCGENSFANPDLFNEQIVQNSGKIKVFAGNPDLKIGGEQDYCAVV